MSNVLLSYNFRFAVSDCSEDLIVLIHYESFTTSKAEKVGGFRRKRIKGARLH